MVSHMVKPCSVLVVFSCSLFFIGFAEAQHVNSMRIHEICQSYTGRRIYLESSEHGFIQATNFSDIHQRYVSLDRANIFKCHTNFHQLIFGNWAGGKQPKPIQKYIKILQKKSRLFKSIYL